MQDEEIKQKFSLRGEPSEVSWGKCSYCKKIKDNIRWQHEKGFLLCDECKSFIEKSLREGKDVYIPKYTYWHYFLAIVIIIYTATIIPGIYSYLPHYHFISSPEPYTMHILDLRYKLYHDFIIGGSIISALSVAFLILKEKYFYLFYLGALLVFSTYIFSSLRVIGYISFVSVHAVVYLITAIYLIYSYKKSFISLR